VTNLYLFVEIELMSQHQDETFTTAENNDAVTLNRRDFLQSAGLAAAGIAASSTLVGAAAQAQETTDYPRPPKLAEKPLKPSTLNTEGISRRTHEEHYKLYQGYVRKSNELFEGISKVTRDPAKANQIYSELREMKVELSFALGGVKNQPQGRLLEEINRSFGSVAVWAADMKATGIAARGWVWTAYDYDLKRLMNYIGDTQNTYPMWNATPIIGLDVYEHAYYLDYGTKRGDYIDAFLKNLNWNAINTRFQLASGPASTLVTLA
jgi:Fe-Mn family superoxide dismutase